VIAVLIDNPGDTRERDLNCNPAWGQFVKAEVLPAVRRSYRVASGRDSVIIGGYSLGGLAAACAAVENPETFGGVMAHSGSFYRPREGEPPEVLARVLAGKPNLGLRWYLDIGRLETAAIPSRDPSMLTSSRHLRDVLTAKGYPVSYHEFTSGHEFVVWRRTAGLALKELMPAKK